MRPPERAGGAARSGSARHAGAETAADRRRAAGQPGPAYAALGQAQQTEEYLHPALAIFAAIGSAFHQAATAQLAALEGRG
ncbi:MAG: hypothetical protein RMK79_13315 [Anaerolineae bacterium]|nr:hypothetical protein [Anaerolineae bacterium]